MPMPVQEPSRADRQLIRLPTSPDHLRMEMREAAPVRQRMYPDLQEMGEIQGSYPTPEISISAGDGENQNATVPIPAEKVYIAVGKEVRENKNNLLWCLEAFPEAKIVILHVHQPDHMVPGPLGGKVKASSLKTAELRAFRQLELNSTMESINEYMSLCARRKKEADQLVWKTEGDVEKGIVEAISHHEIAKLVMGAAADKTYSKKMKAPSSRKAKYVDRYALPSCQITFVCNGNHILTREPYANQNVLLQSNSSPATGSNSTPGSTPDLSPLNSRRRSGFSRLFRRRSNEQHSRTPQTFSRTNSQSSDSMISIMSVEEDARSSAGGDAPSMPIERQEQVESCTVTTEILVCDFGDHQTAAVSTGLAYPVAEHGNSLTIATDEEERQKEADDFLEKLKKTMEESQTLREEAFKESQRRQKAEQEAVEAQHKTRLAEIALLREQRQRKDMETILSKERQQVVKFQKAIQEVETVLFEERQELVNLGKSLQDAESELKELMTEKSSLEAEIAGSKEELQEAVEKLRIAEGYISNVERENLEMQMQRDEALQKVEEISRRQNVESEQRKMMQSFAIFPHEELMKATNNFEPNSIIGEGGSGVVYKGRTRYTLVAIKVLNSQCTQQGSEFNQEVEILSKMRHPHLVTLIGASLECRALVYEYLPNGSLLDRLESKNSAPLNWQTRTRIAAEVCSALLFLHSAGVVHGDLKPGNILLDANLHSKIGDFGISGLMPEHATTMSMSINTDPKGTFAYMDPEFLATGELTPMSDVYSFGVILLQLVTGRSPLWIAKIVQTAVTAGNLQELVDPDAGEWPFIQATQLANIGLRCCKVSRSHRANLETDVWRTLDAMRTSSSPSQLAYKDSTEAPEYFICPIFQEIMTDPHVAADGFTYEAEAIRGWLDSGHDTSPMTNLQLNHLNLAPNHALRSAIEEWHMHA